MNTKIGTRYYDHENHLADVRIGAGYSQMEIAEAIGYRSQGGASMISAVEVGKLSPVYERGNRVGKPKPFVCAICDFLKVHFEDVFPREGCSLRAGLEFSPLQVAAIVHGGIRFCPYESTAESDLMREVRRILGERQFRVLNLYLFSGYTFDEIGGILCLTRMRIQQIYANNLRKLRHPATVRYLGLR